MIGQHPPWIRIAQAIGAAALSPCAKSKRGVAIWRGDSTLVVRHNRPPPGFACDGGATCREHCGKLCVHAEQAALLHCTDAAGAEMLHIKVVDGRAVSSGPPSCWQCSRLILAARVSGVWLLHETGWRRYEPHEFHRLTLEQCGLPIIGP